jgi:plasmid stabilization system protein ParE
LANRDKAPAAFDEELDAIVTSLERDPEQIGQPQRERHRRRVLLRRIRYYLYFRVVDNGAMVQVLALWHASRGSEPELG